MGYSIIFETKFVKLPDGKIIHFYRTGCNNDDAGRHKDEFYAKMYQNENELKIYATKFMQDSEPYKESKTFDLKIGSRCCSYYDYGKHLLRMYKRALSLEEFNAKHQFDFYCMEYKGMELYSPVERTLDLNETNKFWDDYYAGIFSDSTVIKFRNIYLKHKSLDQNVINLIKKWSDNCNSPIRFRIGY